jgi:hypothetical protein
MAEMMAKNQKVKRGKVPWATPSTPAERRNRVGMARTSRSAGGREIMEKLIATRCWCISRRSGQDNLAEMIPGRRDPRP